MVTGLLAADGLAERLRSGSKQAMTEIFSAHLDAVYNYCYRLSGSWSAAEDLTSSVFLEVWRSRQRAVELDGSLLPWLYGVATNVCRNHQRSQRRQARAMTKLRLADIPNGQAADDVVEQVDAEGRAARALERLARLPIADQDVFFLVCWEEMSYVETAEALAIPVGTVRSASRGSDATSA